MVTNELFRQCLAEIPMEHKRAFELSFDIAERLDNVLKKKGISQRDLARKMNKRDSEISKWLTGRHNFTMKTIAQIECAIGEPLLDVHK